MLDYIAASEGEMLDEGILVPSDGGMLDEGAAS